MPEKDITEKILEDYKDVFADIANMFLFDGDGRGLGYSPPGPGV